MELRQLKYFKTVCEQRSFSAAADLCFVTQPAITTSIKRLEAELETKLIDRSAKEILPTEAGRIVLERGMRMLEQEEKLRDEIAELLQSKITRLIIGMPGISCAMFYPLIYEEYLPKHKDLSAQIVDMNSPDVITSVKDGMVDLGFCMLPPALPDGLESLSFSEGRIKVLMSAEHRLAQKSELHFEDLMEERLLFSGRHARNHTESTDSVNVEKLVMEGFAGRNINYNRLITSYCDDNHTLIHLTAAGYGVYCIADTMADIFSHRTDLVIKALRPELCFEIGLVYPSSGLRKACTDFVTYFSQLSYRSYRK